MQPVSARTSSTLAMDSLLVPTSAFSRLRSAWRSADSTASTNTPPCGSGLPARSSMALAPDASGTPRTSADSWDVRVGPCSSVRNEAPRAVSSSSTRRLHAGSSASTSTGAGGWLGASPSGGVGAGGAGVGASSMAVRLREGAADVGARREPGPLLKPSASQAPGL